MLGHNEAMSDQSLVREGVGYDEVFPSGHRPEEDLSWSSEREPSAISPVDEKEDFDGDEVEEREGGEDDEDEDESGKGASVKGSSGSPGDGHTCPFILPAIWTVNDFKSTMMTKIFNNLRDRYQIPNNILICLLGNYEKCYSRKTADVSMYDAMFAAGLRLPLTALHSQLAILLGLFVSQITPNAWRIFMGVEIFWGRLSGGNHQLTLDEFFWHYRPQHIISSQGIYHFATRKKELRLVSDMPNSNRNWKNKFFFCLRDEFGV